MKNAFKSKRVIIIAIALAVLGIGVPAIVFLITYLLPNASLFTAYPALLAAFAAVYLLIGYIWGDLYTVSYRRKNKNWDGQLPDEVKENAWKRRLPFFLSCLAIFIVFMICEIYYWITGGYPFC